MMRGAIVVLALMLAVASAGMALCEMVCAAGGHGDTTVASIDTATTSDVMSCHGGETDATTHNSSLPHGPSHGNTRHAGGHLHARIVATAGAKTPTARAATISVVNNFHPKVALVISLYEYSRSSLNLPPIKLSSAFATGVLRI
jgi:hypothetical protein